MYSNPSNEAIKEFLRNAKTIAVVGLSDKPDRTSYQVSAYMQKQGYKIIPVNPQITSSLGEKAYPDLQSVPVPIDIVNIFRRSEEVAGVVEAAIQVGAKAVWAQQGVRDDEAAKEAVKHGLFTVMDQCIAVAHSVLVK
jgi:predicted CoA-binding protein